MDFVKNFASEKGLLTCGYAIFTRANKSYYTIPIGIPRSYRTGKFKLNYQIIIG